MRRMDKVRSTTAAPPRPSPSRLLLVLLLAPAVLGTACAAPGKTDDRAPSPAARALFHRGQAMARRGEIGRAGKAFRRALESSPLYVEAGRAWQDLLESDFRGHEAYARARALVQQWPGRAEALYLLGRITPDPEVQARLFRRAVEADPDGFWPNLAMGYALLKDRSFQSAEIFFERARKARPRDTRVLCFLASARSARRRYGEAVRALRRASRLEPGNLAVPLCAARLFAVTGKREEAIAVLLELLDAPRRPSGEVRSALRDLLRDETGTAGAGKAWKREQKVLEIHPRSAEALAFAGYLGLRLGRFREAEGLLVRALEAGAEPSRVILDLRLARFALGQYRAGVDAWRRKVPPDLWKARDNEAAPAYERLLKAVEEAEASPGEGAVLVRLGRASMEAGWVAEAAEVLRKASKAGVPEAAALLARARDHLEFVRRLRLFLQGRYTRFLAERDAGDLSSLLEGVSALSREVLGEDLGSGNEVRSFFLIGEVLGGTGEGSPLAAYFARFNQYLVLGRRRGGTPEAVLMTVVYRNRAKAFPVVGGEIACDFAAGEDFALKSFSEYLGGALLGLTLFGRFHANVDEAFDRDFRDWNAYRAARACRDRLSRFGSWGVSRPREAIWLDAGRGLSDRLLLKGFEDREREAKGGILPPPEARTALQGVVDHELMHVKDAARYLPVWDHLLPALGLALRHGFSSTSIEAEMEKRAALAALLRSERPHVELRHILSFAPYPEARLPHSRGYCELLRDLLDHLYDHAGDFPALDPGKNLCRQLHLLSAEELHRVAKALAEAEGL